MGAGAGSEPYHQRRARPQPGVQAALCPQDAGEVSSASPSARAACRHGRAAGTRAFTGSLVDYGQGGPSNPPCLHEGTVAAKTQMDSTHSEDSRASRAVALTLTINGYERQLEVDPR